MTELFRSDSEKRIVRQIGRAAAVGKLMLHELENWQQFLIPETDDLDAIPRRELKALAKDSTSRLSKEIQKFCSKNFIGMNVEVLNRLYDAILTNRTLEIPLHEFESKYAKLNPRIFQGNPRHLTICISLWGLQFRHPEDEISKDLIEAIKILRDSGENLMKFQAMNQSELVAEKDNIATIHRRNTFAARSILLTSFNLLEAYLNGIAWDYATKNDLSNLSNNDKKLLTDHSSNSLREKLIKYPRIISGTDLWDNNDAMIDELIGNIKQFRDSMVHASPFSAPEKFGGYDKLRLLYNINENTAIKTAGLLYLSLIRIENHLGNAIENHPKWLTEFKAALDLIAIITSDESDVSGGN